LIRSIDTRISFCFGCVWGANFNRWRRSVVLRWSGGAKGVALLSLLPCAPPRPRAGGRWRQARSASAAAGGGDTPRQCCPQRGGAAAGRDPGSCLLPSAHAVVGSVRAVVLRDSRAAGRSLAARAAPESAPPRTTGVRSPWTTLRWTQTCSAMAPLMYALRCSCSPLPEERGKLGWAHTTGARAGSTAGMRAPGSARRSTVSAAPASPSPPDAHPVDTHCVRPSPVQDGQYDDGMDTEVNTDELEPDDVWVRLQSSCPTPQARSGWPRSGGRAAPA
jgi:hypothetical protein